MTDSEKDVIRRIQDTQRFVENRCNVLEERNAELEKENAELKEKLDKIRNYLANDIPHELMNEATNKIWRML